MLSVTRNQEGVDVLGGLKLTGLEISPDPNISAAANIGMSEALSDRGRPLWDYVTFKQQRTPADRAVFTASFFYDGSGILKTVAHDFERSLTDQDYVEFMTYELYIPDPTNPENETWIRTRIARWGDVWPTVPEAYRAPDFYLGMANQPIAMYLTEDTFGIQIESTGDLAVIRDFYQAVSESTFFKGADMSDVLMEVFYPDQWEWLTDPKHIEDWPNPFMFCLLRSPATYPQFLDFMYNWKQARSK